MPQAPPKWRRQPEARPEQILEAALDVFSEHGFRAATMEQVAQAAGIAKGTIYLYYESKEALFIAMVRAELRHALALLPEMRFEPGDDPESLTRRLGKQALDVLMAPRMGKVLPLVAAQYRHIPELKRIYQEEIMPEANFRLAELLELGMNLGMVRRLDPVIAARCLFGMFAVFAITQEFFGAKEVTPMTTDDIAATIATIYFHGILAGSTAHAD